MNVFAIISRDLEKASTKYRLVQYMDFLKYRGVNFEFIHRKQISSATLDILNRFDLLFNQKCLFRYALAKKMIQNSKRVIFDFDDAIYTASKGAYSLFTRLRVKRRLKLWLQHADVVTTPNRFLGAYAGQYSSSVKIVPMALNLDLWKPVERNINSDGITIGWVGAPVNLPLIEKLDPILKQLLERNPLMKLSIFSGVKPRLNSPFEFTPFQPGKEHDFVQKLDIGLLPLRKSAHAMGKSPIKSIQYLACGVPVVGNVFGATSEILNKENSIAVDSDDQWISAIESLSKDRSKLDVMKRAARDFAVLHHDIKSVSVSLLDILLGNP